MAAVPLAAAAVAALVTGGAALVAGWGPPGSVLLALGAALAAGALAYRWSSGRTPAARHGGVRLAGRDGTVVTAVPGAAAGAAGTAGADAVGADGRTPGEVSLVVDGHVVRMVAYADVPLAVGAPVRVIRALSATSVLVEPR